MSTLEKADYLDWYQSELRLDFSAEITIMTLVI